MERWKPHKVARHSTRCDVINDVNLFPTVYCRIYSRKFLALSNQTSRYKTKCIRIHNDFHRNSQDLYSKELNSMIFQCIWNGKDKIKRDTLSQDFPKEKEY